MNNNEEKELKIELRDYFAAAALQGICSCNLSVKIEEIAKYAYEQADAMLQARKEWV